MKISSIERQIKKEEQEFKQRVRKLRKERAKAIAALKESLVKDFCSLMEDEVRKLIKDNPDALMNIEFDKALGTAELEGVVKALFEKMVKPEEENDKNVEDNSETDDDGKDDKNDQETISTKNENTEAMAVDVAKSDPGNDTGFGFRTSQVG